MDDTVKVTILGDEISAVYGKKGSNLLDLLRQYNIFIDSVCSGKGTCGKCRVRILKGDIKPSAADTSHLKEDEIRDGVHLACTVELSDDIEIEVIKNPSAIVVLTEGNDGDTEICHPLRKVCLNIDVPSLNDQRSDVKRVKDALGINEIHISNSLARKIVQNIREWDFKASAVLYKNELLDIEQGNTTDRLYGAAVDIGTTTVACYLVDMQSGKVMDVESAMNSQRLYGADVISRINYTMENDDGLSKLQNLIINQINSMLKSICARQNIKGSQIYNMTVVGNTTMMHLFQGLPCQNISMSPFVPCRIDFQEIKGAELGINISGYVNMLPGVASYVGSDITAGILSCGIHKSKSISLLLDLGTNGEIVIGNCDELLACSTAAGPAFEGASIKHGAGGIMGAISRVDLSKEKIYETIGEANGTCGSKKPCGICGSGVVDLVYQMLKYNIIDETGKMANNDEVKYDNIKSRIIESNGMKEFVLDSDITFTQKDVREVQLASAAVSAGIKILMKEKGITGDDIENVYIAGGFGNYMDIESAAGIGLIPKTLLKKVKPVGNSAGTGARMCLLSTKNIHEVNYIAEKTKYIELSLRQDFQEYFIDSMTFGG